MNDVKNNEDTFDFIINKYSKKGLKIFPVEMNGKIPILNNWLNECSSEFYQLAYWFSKNKNYNWGLPANPNDLFILDIDTKDGQNGLDSIARLMKDFNFDINDTLMRKTWSGGLHVFYKSDDELKNVINCANAFPTYPNIDIRSAGFVVCEPSVINGQKYEFINDNDIKEMPALLKEFILNIPTLIKNKDSKKSYELPKEIIKKGNRDCELFRYMNSIYQKTNLSYDEIDCLAHWFNETMLESPLPDRTIDYKMKKLFSKERNRYFYVKMTDFDENNQ